MSPEYDYVVRKPHQAADELRALRAENAKLKEIIAESAEVFESAAEGGGVNFYQCAVDLRDALAALVEGKE